MLSEDNAVGFIVLGWVVKSKIDPDAARLGRP